MRRLRPFAFLFFLTAAAPWCPAASFTVLAYNVQNWLSAEDAPEDAPAPATAKSDAEKDAVIAIIAARRPAILGVVEMGTRADFEDFRRRLATRGLDFPHAEWHEGLDSERHVALLSRFPIVARNSPDDVAFDLAGQPSGIQRGILDVTVEPAPGYHLRLIGLHLKSRRKVPGLDEAALRAKEAWAVRGHLDEILTKEPRTRLLLFGDLNDTKDQSPIRELLGPRGTPTRLTDIPVEDRRGERWTHYFRTADEYARIDFFLASAALLPEINRARSGIDDSPRWHEASDHRAIFLAIDPASK